jgi:polo-like kinase 1
MEQNQNNQPVKKETQEFIVETPVFIEETLYKSDGKTSIRKYERGKFLGKGGFAKCYELKCLETKKTYAAKLFPKKELQNSKSKKKLINEIKLHKKLHHPNIVKIEHFFEDNENVYILLELCPNQTLNDLLKRRKRITELEAQYYLIQLVSALKYIHKHKIIHRDLKLGNCFLSANMEPKLGDFGLSAKLEFEGQKRKTICGTPNYIAPEILEKTGHSYEVDTWSLGVMFYTLIFGKPPFETNEVKLTYKKIKMNSYTFPEFVTVHPSTKKLISSIFNLDPSKRPSFDQILEHDFFKIFNSIPKSLPNLTLACPPSVKFLSQYLKTDPNYDMQHMVKSVMKHNSISSMDDLNNNKNTTNDALNKNISGSHIYKTIDNNMNLASHRKCESGMNFACLNIEKNVMNTINIDENIGDKLKILLKNSSNSRNPVNLQSSNSNNNNINDYVNFLINNNNEEAKLPKTNSINNNIVNNNFYINLGSLNSLEFKLDKNMLDTLNTNRESNMNINSNQAFKDIVKIHKFYDYSNKFGVIFFLNNNYIGVCFNDFTNILKSTSLKKAKTIILDKDSKKDKVIDDQMFENYLKNKNESKDFIKRLEVFKQVLGKFQNENKSDDKMISISESNTVVFLKKFIKTQQAILFRLSNKLIQIFFSDKSELILSTKGLMNMAFYKSKTNEEVSDLIENIMNSDNEDLIKKIRYAKNLLINFIKSK